MEEIKKLENKRKNCIFILISGLISLFISLIFIINYLFLNKVVLLILLIIFLIIGLILLLFGFSLFSSIEKNYKAYLIKTINKEIIPNSIYYENKGVPLDEIYKSGLLEVADKSTSYNLLKSSYNGIDFEGCNLVLEERTVHTLKNGNRNINYMPYFSGKVLIFDFNRQFISNLVLSESSLNKNITMKKQNFINLNFNKKYKIYADDNKFVYNFLTNDVINCLLDLEKINPDSLMLSCFNSKLYIAINNVSLDDFKIKINKEINDDYILFLKERINIISKLLVTIKNNNIFKK